MLFKHYAMLYPQNGDRIAAVYFVTSFHPMYYFFTPFFRCPSFPLSLLSCHFSFFLNLFLLSIFTLFRAFHSVNNLIRFHADTNGFLYFSYWLYLQDFTADKVSILSWYNVFVYIIIYLLIIICLFDTEMNNSNNKKCSYDN